MVSPIPSAERLEHGDGHENDIIRVASYHRRDFDLAVIRLNPREHDSVQSLMAHPFKRTAEASLGRLEALPLEILHEIFLLLDIQSLFLFRQVNLRARQVVSTVRGYQPLMVQALESLCIILRTKISSWYTFRDLVDVLRTRDCPQCGSFAGFVFLPSFERCCFPCLTTAPHFRVRSVTEAGKRLNVSKGSLRKLVPVLRTIPGIYSMDETSRKKSMYTIAEQMAMAFASSNDSGETRASHHPTWGREVSILRFMAATALPYLDSTNGAVQHGICCTGCQIALEEDKRSDLADACTLRDRIYSHAGFLDHFRRCPEAQSLWKFSKEGRVAVKVPESVRRGGYFNERDVVMSFKKRKYEDFS